MNTIPKKLFKNQSIRGENILLKKVVDILADKHPNKWKVKDGRNIYGDEIKDVHTIKIGNLEISFEDRKNQGVGFYLQVYDMHKRKCIACILRLHKENSVYLNINKQFRDYRESLKYNSIFLN